MWFLEIEDNGPGISDLENIIEPLLHQQEGRPGHWSCDQENYREAHRGTLATSNRSVGGACFRLKLPVRPVCDSAFAKSNASPPLDE